LLLMVRRRSCAVSNHGAHRRASILRNAAKAPLFRMRVIRQSVRKRPQTMTSPTLKTIHDGGHYFEGPRWHAGKLWFVDCMARTLLSLGTSGGCEQHAKFDDDTPCGTGVLPDGTLIVLPM